MIEPRVIYEDKNFLAINKPAGLLTHGVRISNFPRPRQAKQDGRFPISEEPTLVDWLLKKYPGIKNVGDEPKIRPGIVHRLDRDASGVLIVAKNQKYFEYLKSLFQTRKITKTYLALVWGNVEPKRGIIEKPIGIKNGTLKRSVNSQKMAKEAVTKYEVIKYGTWKMEKGTQNMKRAACNTRQRTLYVPYSLLYVYPQTGRTHQIRLHLASIGHPVVGDALYGKLPASPRLRQGEPNSLSAKQPRLMLHALSLEFTPEPGRVVKIETELPKEFAKLIHTPP